MKRGNRLFANEPELDAELEAMLKKLRPTIPELTIDVSNGLTGEEADLLFLLVGVLVKRAGGKVEFTWDELEELDEQFDTTLTAEGVTVETIVETL